MVLRAFAFVNHEIPANRHGGHRRHVRYRSAALMRRHYYPIRLRHVGDLAQLGHPAGMHYIGLNSRRSFHVEQLFELETREKSLAGGNGTGLFAATSQGRGILRKVGSSINSG